MSGRARGLAAAALAAATVAAAAAGLGGCAEPLDAGGRAVDGGVDDDPLAIDEVPADGSFDDLHRRILAPRCSGQPGLCHNGQFEPNLSTPSLAYAYLVRRPSLEKPDRYRVAPGDPDASVLIDKLRGRDVATRMPLGAEPLAEADVRALEAWIADGGRRRPGAVEAPVLDEPPAPPEIGVFDAGGARLDGPAGADVVVGQTVTLRHSAHDFETADAAIPFAAFFLAAPDGRDVVLAPAATDGPHVGATAYDAAGPMGAGDQLDFRRDWTVTDPLELYDEATDTRTPVTASGLVVTPIAVYLDAYPGGIAAFAIGQPIRIQ
ncbi:MAG: hypothetical protein H6709_05165 [Kofleriaceae bacterium]|nr:hypothetical protein [Kofleriaceae bacterium]MCB9571462.1 hypothetical protein [Kofleriaceae bacterium]